MLLAPSLPPAKLLALARLARDIPRYPGVPAKQQELLAEFNRTSGLELAIWQFAGAVFWPRETTIFVECALSHLESPAAPSAEAAAQWIGELRDRKGSMADAHHTLRSLELLSRHPEDVARLIYFTDVAAERVLAALAHDDRSRGLTLLGSGESAVEPGAVDDQELASVVALADLGIDCSDRGDRDGLTDATRELTKRTGQLITEQELRALPGAMSTEPWARGLLLGRNLLARTQLTWSECRYVVARYFRSIHALDDPSMMAFEALLDAATPYPHLRIHHDMPEGSEQQLETTLCEVTRHVDPWGDPPPGPSAVTVDDVWRAAREWAVARETKQWAVAVSCKAALQQALDQLDIPQLRELLSLRDADRRARMGSLGLLPDGAAAPVVAPPAEPMTPERVEHPKFGVGEVVTRVGQGELAIVEVRFPDGVRKLQARFLSRVR